MKIKNLHWDKARSEAGRMDDAGYYKGKIESISNSFKSIINEKNALLEKSKTDVNETELSNARNEGPKKSLNDHGAIDKVEEVEM